MPLWDDTELMSLKPFDFLVLGSGIAGLSFALNAARRGRVAIITKKNRAESNTNYAQGGIAAVTSKEDSFEMHVRDTLEAGAGLCHEPVVRTIVQEGPARIAELIELGMQFSERELPHSHGARELDLGKEGGHSKRRILHARMSPAAKWIGLGMRFSDREFPHSQGARELTLGKEGAHSNRRILHARMSPAAKSSA